MNGRWRRLAALIEKELRQLLRDRVTFAMIVGIPSIQLLLFGYAINMDLRHLNAAVFDSAGTSHSRELVAELTQTQVFDFRYTVHDQGEIDALLREGRIAAALIIPRDFERRLHEPDRAAAQIVVDGSDQVVQQAARQLAAFPAKNFALGAVSFPAQSQIEIVNFYNPERRAALNTVPGLIGVILMMTMVMFTSMAIVRERERGNLEFLITTPLTSFELMLGKVLPFVAIGLVQTSVVLLLGWWIFSVPVRGSLLELYCAALLYIAACLGLGVLISTLARSQFQSMQMAVFTFLPQILLSGFMFPFDGMPQAVRWFAEIMPLTHFIRLVRGIVLRSAHLTDLWVDVLALAVFALVVMTAATLRFRKRLD